MPTPEAITDTIHAYVDGFDRGDAGAIKALFATDATVEDPVGSPPHRGHEAIEHFYAESMKTGAKLKLHGPIRIAGSSAAFAFSATVGTPDGAMRIDVIDIFEFDEAGKVASMKAYFGPTNFNPANGDA